MKLIKLFIALILILSSKLMFAEKTNVNALAFWGYLDDPKISELIERKCNVKFSHDDYWTNSDFLTTYKKRSSEYDVVILSNIIYGSVKNQLPNFDSGLWKNAYKYHPYIKNYFLSHNYGKNTSFFTLTMIGFLYNPKNIKITPEQSAFDIFNNAKDKDVILIDDSAEIGSLLTEAYKHKYKVDTQTKLTYSNLKNLTQDARVYITSDFGKLFGNPNFAFAYVWSGDALQYIKNSKKPYKFITPVSSSYICTDLVVQLKNNPHSKCVADVLTSPEFFKYFEKDTYYFSPYFKDDIHDPMYDKIYYKTKNNLNKYKMLQPILDFDQYYDSQWKSIKVKYSEALHEKK